MSAVYRTGDNLPEASPRNEFVFGDITKAALSSLDSVPSAIREELTTCLPCPLGTTCAVSCKSGEECDGFRPSTPDDDGFTLQELRLLAGYYRHSENSTVIKKCNMIEGCNRGCMMGSNSAPVDPDTHDVFVYAAGASEWKESRISSTEVSANTPKTGTEDNKIGYKLHMHADLGDQCNMCREGELSRQKLGHMCPLSLIGLEVDPEAYLATSAPTSTMTPTPGPTVTKEYVKAEAGELTCPAGTTPVTTHAGCQQASAWLAGVDYHDYGSRWENDAARNCALFSGEDVDMCSRCQGNSDCDASGLKLDVSGFDEDESNWLTEQCFHCTHAAFCSGGDPGWIELSPRYQSYMTYQELLCEKIPGYESPSPTAAPESGGRRLTSRSKEVLPGGSPLNAWERVRNLIARPSTVDETDFAIASEWSMAADRFEVDVMGLGEGEEADGRRLQSWNTGEECPAQDGTCQNPATTCSAFWGKVRTHFRCWGDGDDTAFESMLDYQMNAHNYPMKPAPRRSAGHGLRKVGGWETSTDNQCRQTRTCEDGDADCVPLPPDGKTCDEFFMGMLAMGDTGVGGDNPETRSSNEICNEGYEGPLCNICVNDIGKTSTPAKERAYFKETWTNRCLLCTAANTAMSPKTFALIGALIVVAIAGMGTTFMNREALMRWYERREDLIKSISCSGTTIFITYQILSSLPKQSQYSGGLGYPDPFSVITAALEVFQLDIFSIIHADCIKVGFRKCHPLVYNLNGTDAILNSNYIRQSILGKCPVHFANTSMVCRRLQF